MNDSIPDIPDPQLLITGEVLHPATITFQTLVSLPAEHQIPDVRRIVPDRPGTAVTLKGLLELVHPLESVRYLSLHASTDNFHASIPLSLVLEKGLLIYGLDGEPLPSSKGGPFRFFIPDHLACQTAEIDECANVKFVDHIELSSRRGEDNRPHDDEAHAALHARQEPPDES